MSEIIPVNFPEIGEGVVEGEVIQWLKKINDIVKEHEPVVIVMTDKATVELPSPYAGKIAKQYYREGEMAIRDKPLYDVEVVSSTQQDSPHTTPIIEQKKVPIEQLKKPKPSQQPNKRVLASPANRKLAKDLDIEIANIKGTGKEGEVTKEDIINAFTETLQSQKKSHVHTPTPILHWEDDEEFPIRGIRNLMAEKMVESKSIIPHFSYFDQMDVSRLVKMRENIRKEATKENISLSYMPFFIRALSLTLKKYPLFNGSIDLEDNTLVIHKHQNIGIAFKTDAGLLVPVLKNVESMSFSEVIKAYHHFKVKASEGKLTPADMRESTITISNFGTLGGLWATPIINYPEVAILGIAKIHKEPVVVNNDIVARDMLNLSWSFDHRVIDGDQASEFSNYFIGLLKNPAGLL